MKLILYRILHVFKNSSLLIQDACVLCLWRALQFYWRDGRLGSYLQQTIFFYFRRDFHLGNISEQILLEKQLDVQQDSRWSANHFVRACDGETSGFVFKGIWMALLSRQRWVFLLSSKALNVLPYMLSCVTSTIWNIDYFFFLPQLIKCTLGDEWNVLEGLDCSGAAVLLCASPTVVWRESDKIALSAPSVSWVVILRGLIYLRDMSPGFCAEENKYNFFIYFCVHSAHGPLRFSVAQRGIMHI